jgi:predicted glycoside hydrolase/deacetylase ChbG (UPF0249 family)
LFILLLPNIFINVGLFLLYMIKLIINADDFGMSAVFNEVILSLLESNKIYSTTVMINRILPNQQDQVARLIDLSDKNKISIGLHIEYSSKNYEEQIRSQVVKFSDVFGKLPSHLDIHKAGDFPDSFHLVAKISSELNIPYRNMGAIFEESKTTKEEALFGSVEDFQSILNWLKSLKDSETYEILFHPGKYDPDCKSSYNANRERDVKYIGQILELSQSLNIKIVSFLDL